MTINTYDGGILVTNHHNESQYIMRFKGFLLSNQSGLRLVFYPEPVAMSTTFRGCLLQMLFFLAALRH